jgi:hypothetical protein
MSDKQMSDKQMSDKQMSDKQLSNKKFYINRRALLPFKYNEDIFKVCIIGRGERGRVQINNGTAS